MGEDKMDKNKGVD